MPGASDRDLAIRVRAIIDDFVNPMRTAQTELKTFANTAVAEFGKVEASAERIRNVWKGLFEAFIGFEIVKGLKEMALATDQARMSLEAAAASAADFGKSLVPEEMEKQLQALARSAQGGGYSIDQMRLAIQRFASVGADGAQATRLLHASLELAARRMVDLDTASHVFMMAASGHIEMMSRYGVRVKDAAGHLLSLNEVIAQFERPASAAEIRAAKLEGAFGRMANAFKNVIETAGAPLIPWFDALANAMTHLADAIAKTPPWLIQLAAGLTFVTLGLTALGLATPAVKLLFEFLYSGAMIAVAAFATFIKTAGFVVMGLRDLVTWLGLARDAFITLSIAEWAVQAPLLAIIGAITAVVALVVEAIRGFRDLATVWQFLSHLFTSTIGKPFQTPKPDLTNLDKAKGGDQKGVNDWLKAQLAAVDTFLSHFTLGVDKARAQLDLATANRAGFKAGLDPAATRTVAEVREEERLIKEELKAQQALRVTLAAQHDAQLKAAQSYRAIEAQLPAGDKERVGHIAELEKKFNEANIAAAKIEGTINKMSAAGKAAAVEIRTAWLALFTDLGDQMAARLRDGLERVNSMLESSIRGIQTRGRIAAASGRAVTPQQIADASATAAVDAFTIAQKRAAEASNAVQQAENAWNAFAEARKRMTAKQLEAAQLAHNAEMRRLLDAVALSDAEARVARAIKDHAEAVAAASARTQLLQGTAGKIPGVAVSDTGALSFNWVSVLVQAISQSKSFADIMNVVNQLMKLFAQIIDALRPAIDLLLHAVIAIVNIFIELWNGVARLLRLLGVHIALLEKLNQDLSATGAAAVPLIAITHDIPTLTELASGKIAPIVAPGGTGGTSLVNAIQAQTTSQQGWFGTLIQDAAILLGVDWLTHGKFFADAAGWFGGLGTKIGSFFSDLWGKISTVWNNMPSQIKGGIEAVTGWALLTNHFTGIAHTLGQILGVLMLIDGLMKVFGSPGGLGQLLGLGGAGGAGLAGAGLATAGGALIGAGVGQFIYGGGSHTTWGAVGGAAGVAGAGAIAGGFMAMGGAAGGMTGGISALLAMGPAGWGILAGAGLLGGLVGGAFGHKDDPSKMPDKYNTAAWGQFLANFGLYNATGPDNTHNQIASGQSFNIASDIGTATDNKGIGDFLASLLKTDAGDLQKALGDTEFSQVKAMFTAWNDSIRGKDGSFNVGGQSFNWADIAKLGTDAYAKFLQYAGANAPAGAAGSAGAIASGATDYSAILAQATKIAQQSGVDMGAFAQSVTTSGTELSPMFDKLTVALATVVSAFDAFTARLTAATTAVQTQTTVFGTGAASAQRNIQPIIAIEITTGNINSPADVTALADQIAEKTSYAIRSNLRQFSLGGTAL